MTPNNVKGLCLLLYLVFLVKKCEFWVYSRGNRDLVYGVAPKILPSHGVMRLSVGVFKNTDKGDRLLFSTCMNTTSKLVSVVDGRGEADTDAEGGRRKAQRDALHHIRT